MGTVSSSSSTPLVDRIAMRLPTRVLVVGGSSVNTARSSALSSPSAVAISCVDSRGTVGAASDS